MKPETLERRARERIIDRIRQRASLIERLTEKAREENDPSGFWADLLNDALSAHS